jgi:hypothetical protein
MRTMLWSCAAAMAVVLATGSARATAEEIPLWPDEQEQRLKELSNDMRAAQRERFDALFFSKDKEEQKRLDKRVREVQKERSKLLRARGQ